MRFLIVLLFSLTASAQQYIDDYFPLHKKWAPTMDTANNAVTGGWAMVNDGIYWASGGSLSNLNWSSVTNKELFEVRHNCSDGQSYLFLNGYKPHNTSLPSYVVYWLKATKVLITTGSNVFDITHVAKGNGGCEKWVENFNNSGKRGRMGFPFAPYRFWNQPYRLQVWGKICDQHGVCNQRRFYWDAQWQPYLTSTNDCWTGPGSATRSTINLTEAYWDSILGWTQGNGAMNPSTGQPTGTGISYGRTIGYGLDVGPNWTYLDLVTGNEQCVQNVHSW